jgi:Fur family ferric uptake transcriptional regulator
MDQLRSTINKKQKLLIQLLEESSTELSGQELHRVLQEYGQGMGLATVYRHLRQLQQRGMLRSRHLPTGEVLYAPLARDQHHLNCLNCGATEQLDYCPLHSLEVPKTLDRGFQLLFHTLEFYGICKDCQVFGED